MCQARPVLSIAWIAPVAIKAAGGKADQRHRRNPRIDRMALAGDPMHALRPARDAAFFVGAALEQRQIEFAAFEVAAQINALIRPHIEPQARMRARKRRQQFGQPIGREILGNAEPDRAFAAGPRHHVAGLLGQRQ